MRVLTTLALQSVSACSLNLPRHFLHRPLELTLELTGCCARARDFGVAESECLHFEPSLTCPPSPRWNVTCSVFGLQGGGLYIAGTATLTNTNVYSNQATEVRSLSALGYFLHRPAELTELTACCAPRVLTLV